MSIYDWLTVAAVVICLLISAFYSGSETALTASSRAAMNRLEKHGNVDATIVSRLLAQRERFLGAVLLANNGTNIAASTLATGLLLTLFGQAGVIYATVVMTALIFVLCEVLPKTVAFNAPDRLALVVAQPIARTVTVLLPILKAVEWLVRIILRVHRHAGRQDSIDPLAARRAARRRRSPASRRRRGKARPRHDGRRARPARADGVRRHGPPHQDGDDRCRRPAARDRRRGAWRAGQPAAALARLARQYSRCLAREGFAARAARGRRRRLQDRHRGAGAPALVRARHHARSTSNSRRSATARRRSRSWSTSTASWKGW